MRRRAERGQTCQSLWWGRLALADGELDAGDDHRRCRCPAAALERRAQSRARGAEPASPSLPPPGTPDGPEHAVAGWGSADQPVLRTGRDVADVPSLGGPLHCLNVACRPGGLRERRAEPHAKPFLLSSAVARRFSAPLSFNVFRGLWGRTSELLKGVGDTLRVFVGHDRNASIAAASGFAIR